MNLFERARAFRWATYGDMTDAEIREYLGGDAEEEERCPDWEDAVAWRQDREG